MPQSLGCLRSGLLRRSGSLAWRLNARCLVAASEDFAAVLDSLVICKFLRKCFDDFYPEAARVLSAVTGWNYSDAELRQTGARIHTLKKLFNIREGWQPKDDGCPSAC